MVRHGRRSFGGWFPAALMLGCVLASTAMADPIDTDSAINIGKRQTLRSHNHDRPDPPNIVADTKLHPNAAQGLAMEYSGAPIDVTTYHYDGLRTGWNQKETALTRATVKSAKFGKLATLAVDGIVYAEPLLVSNFTMPDGAARDVLIVATSHNSVYAFDAKSYAVLWKVNLGPSQSTDDVGCADVVPEYGITSTPAIVRTAADAAIIYLVAATEPQSLIFHTKVHALDLATGHDVLAPAEIAPSTRLTDGETLSFSAQNQWNRAGIAYNNNALYIGFGSHCDNDSESITGWLLRYTQRLKLQTAFATVHSADLLGTGELGSIWMAGFAPAIDEEGDVFVATGNGNTRAKSRDYGEAALKLTPTLSGVTDYFSPADSATLNRNDRDFGSGGVMLLPAVTGQPRLAVAMGKNSPLYLLDRDNMGKTAPNDAGALQAVAVPGSDYKGGPAYYAGPDGPYVYVQRDSSPLLGFSVSAGAKPQLTKRLQGTTIAGYGGSFPIVSSNGAVAGTGIVWLVRRAQTVQLEAYDALHLGAPIYTAAAGRWLNTNNNAFVSPLEANGRVYVPAYKTVTVFGLTP
jgi:hypothetical protein